MSRIDQSRWNTRPKHYPADADLLGVIADFIVTIDYGEVPCYALRQKMIDTIEEHRPGIQSCTTDLDDFVKRIRDESMGNHHELVSMLNALSIACKIANATTQPSPVHLGKLPYAPIDLTILTNQGFFKQLKIEVSKLIACTQEVKFT